MVVYKGLWYPLGHTQEITVTGYQNALQIAGDAVTQGVAVVYCLDLRKVYLVNINAGGRQVIYSSFSTLCKSTSLCYIYRRFKTLIE
jgi:hypothetical protein